jgi:ankyrin repeat protein
MNDIIAISENDMDPRVCIILRPGEDPNDRKEGCEYPLITAIRYDSLESVYLVLDRGADPNVASEDDHQALDLAIRVASDGIVKELLDWGADIDFRVPDSGESAVSVAISEDREDIVPTLLQYGAGADEADRFGITPLMILQESSTCAILLEAGADPNKRDNQGLTPLMHMILDANIPAIDLLLRSGADADIENVQVYRALRRMEPPTTGHTRILDVEDIEIIEDILREHCCRPRSLYQERDRSKYYMSGYSDLDIMTE